MGKKQVEQELIMQQAKHNKIKEIFMDDEETGTPWHERKQFQTLLNNLDTRTNLIKYQLELDSYCKELQKQYDMNKKKLDTYKQAGKESDTKEDENQNRHNYEDQIYEMKHKLKRLDKIIEDKRHKDISVTEHHLKLNQFANQILYSLYQYPMPATEITKIEEIKEKATSLVETIKENVEEERYKDFIEGNDEVDNDLLEASGQDFNSRVVRDLFPESSVASPVRFRKE